MVHTRPTGGFRGFTLVELMVAVSLAAILLGVIGFNFRGQSKRASSKSVAVSLSEALREARLQSLAEQRPVAVVLPSDGGSRPHSKGFFVLKGYGQGKLVRIRDFSGEADGEMFVGLWPLNSPYSNSMGIAAPPTEVLDLNTWLPTSMAKDYAFVFLPNGTVQTNDLPAFDGSYHILTGTGFQYAATSPPAGLATVSTAPGYFAPSRAADAYTVSLSYYGKVTVTQGVLDDSGSVATGPGPSSGTTAATTVAPAGSTSNAPTFDKIVVTPELDPALIPPGTDTVVRVGDHLTLTVTATDSDNDELFCEWTGTTGNFSSPGETRMEWNEKLQKRVSVWTWTPPSTALPGDSFTLTCKVRDENGNVAAPIVGSVIDVTAVEQGTIHYLRGNVPYTCRPDGSGDRPLETAALGNWREVHALSTGNRMCFSYIPPGKTLYEIWTANLDGSNSRRLLAIPGQQLEWARMNPQGTAVAWTGSTGGPSNIWICAGDGSNPHQLLFYPDSKWCSWAPDGKRFAYVRGNTDVAIVTLDTSLNVVSDNIIHTSPYGPIHYMEWSQEVNPRLVVHGWGAGNHFFTIMNADGSGVVNLPPVPTAGASQAYWSPDGTQLIYGNYDDLWVINSDGSGKKHILTGPNLDFPVWTP